MYVLFDIRSLFTCVALEQICWHLRWSVVPWLLPSLRIHEDVFMELMKFYQWNSVLIIWCIDGLAMGSTLGPIMANIFVDFLRVMSHCTHWITQVLNGRQLLCVSKRGWDVEFHVRRTPVLFFFPDDSIERWDAGFLTSVNLKSTFTDWYTRWSFLCSKQQKIKLIKTLVHRI